MQILWPPVCACVYIYIVYIIFMATYILYNTLIISYAIISNIMVCTCR